jgi:PAS domain S-box-containing protein
MGGLSHSAADPPATRRATARRDVSRDAQVRLQKYVLLGATGLQFVNALVWIALVLLDGDVDASVMLPYGPDLLVSALVWWLTLARRALRGATIAFAVYLAINYLVLFLHVGSLALLGTPWPLVPPLFGLYVGGRRLGLWMTLAMVLGAACSLVVHLTGVGLTTMTLPSLDEPSGTMLAGAGGVVLLLLVAVHEHARRRMQRDLDGALTDLDAQEQTLLTLVESSSDAILLLDADYRIRAANSAVQRLVPTIRGEGTSLLGASFWSIVSDERLPLWRSRLAACAESGRERMEDVLPLPSGDLHLETSMHRLLSGGELAGFTLFARDITERREAEATLQRLRGQLLEASRHAGRAEVAAGVLHNVGNVLNNVSVSVDQLDAIAEDLRVASFRKAIDLLGDESDALQGVLGERSDKLLRYLRALVAGLETERQRLKDESRCLRERLEHIHAILQAQQKHGCSRGVHEEIDLEELIRAALTLDEGWAGHGIELTWEVAPEASRIVSDRHKLLQILINLLRNARDAVVAIDGTREVRVEVRGAEDGVRLTVADTGIGIAEEHRGAIFAHGFTTKTQGNGFGLHSAALLADELGGQLGFVSEGVNRGATFSLALPRRPTRRAQAELAA